ncbi:S-methyl-5-thioribose-1-phosphate isomerase [Desulfovibrio sp. OttesenSCG-928-C14]|nr:S-methyl-5-thioribose-1-phosphate isomerase [Desulfovibrio sp. OttesenSCG-928-C14]
MNYHIKPEPEQKRLLLLDQRALPEREEFYICRGPEDVVFAIKNMVVRGAPAIGVTASWGAWLAALRLEQDGLDKSRHWEPLLEEALGHLEEARPTAVNLSWAVRRMRSVWRARPELNLKQLVRLWREEAENIHADDIELNLKMGAYGAALLDDGDTVMTHCNAGSLATAGYGTALGVIYAAVEAGKNIKVISNETRPLLQGSRLSAYELHKAGIDVTVACDNACAVIMARGRVQKVITGADRIAANGDTANKIGTFGVALLARNFDIPFYIAAPSSTFDRDCPSGTEIPIEERDPEEVTCFAGRRTAPEGVKAVNYAFDVTPAELISAIVTEKGLITPPYSANIKKALGWDN